MSGPEHDFIEVDKLRLPPPVLRWGGPRYKDDQAYIRSGKSNAQSLAFLCGLSKDSRVLDIGCGQGRLLTGILATFGGIREYVGLDVHKPSIDWATAALADPNLNISFRRLDILNERYNPKGESISSSMALPIPSDHFDLVALYSVFSHMHLTDISSYLIEIRRALAPPGKVFCSLFVEYGVKDEEENPAGYHREWAGPLHCVRINRPRFEELVYDSGLIVEYFKYRHTNDGQSTYVLARRSSSPFQAKVILTTLADQAGS
jgi:SAM-dependent methyltransferase